MSADMAVPLELMSRVERYLVYRCYSNDGALLYVGRTGRGGKRLAEHADKVWFLGVRAVTFEWYADELDARNAERLAIQVEHPRYNMQHRNGHYPQVAAPKMPAPPTGDRRKDRRSESQLLAEARHAYTKLVAENGKARQAEVALKIRKARQWVTEHWGEIQGAQVGHSGQAVAQ